MSAPYLSISGRASQGGQSVRVGVVGDPRASADARPSTLNVGLGAQAVALPVPVTARERAAMTALTDAIAGTRILQGKTFVPPSLDGPDGYMRITTDQGQGPRAVDITETSPAYAAIKAPFENYVLAAAAESGAAAGAAIV